MARIEIPSKIRAENFKDEDREVVKGIASIYNQFVDQIYGLLQKKVDFDNLNRELVTVTVTIDASGKIANPPAIKYTISKPRGIVCVGATCLTSNALTPTSTPFVTPQIGTGIISILSVTGLQPNSQYSLVLELIG